MFYLIVNTFFQYQNLVIICVVNSLSVGSFDYALSYLKVIVTTFFKGVKACLVVRPSVDQPRDRNEL